MSLKVLVIPEDPTNNGYILKPLVLRIMDACGKPNAKVTVLTNPRAQGYEHARRLIHEEVLERYAHFDLLLFLPDRDGKDRAAELKGLERVATGKGVSLLCCAAVEEVETWVLAGHGDKLARGWSEIRADVSVKEAVFDDFLAKHGDARRAGGGRDVLMGQTLTNYGGLIQRCPELGELEERVRRTIEGGEHAA